MAVNPIDITSVVSAIGTLGTASFALVDSTKIFGGGISKRGFGHVEQVLSHLFPANVNKQDRTNPVTYRAVRETLFANWINGVALADQKSVAKTLIKMRLDATTSAHLAVATGVDAAILKSLADKYANGGALTAEEQNVAGRFDLLLATLLDEGYQRADQSYRNSARGLAIVFSVLLALAGRYTVGDAAGGYGLALLVGLLAAPLAPISKDLTSALQAGVKAMQGMRK